ncbi:MAG: DUF1003 domain-containing protein [Anaerolineales bacterium]|nr:DUF1003 domain-containing protein [Anaerolineales bacterium]MCB8952462.1 DUF1003 domain-containing protein [Ardenticatenales bacterium]
MPKLKFPQPFIHYHPPVQDVNQVFTAQLTPGQRAADWVANFVGSWPFLIGQSLLLLLWIMLNVVGFLRHWDPYPFILMNLILSTQAAFTAPVIMMSQNRQAARDRLEAHNDFLINQKAEEEIRAMLDNLAAQNEAIARLHEMLVELQAQQGQQP